MVIFHGNSLFIELIFNGILDKMIIFSHISYKIQKSELLCGHWLVGIDIGTPHVRAPPPRGPKMLQNSENDHIRVFALLTRKKVVTKQFFKLADISGAPGMSPAR